MATGFPSPQLSWKLENKELGNENSSVTIEKQTASNLVVSNVHLGLNGDKKFKLNI